MGYTESKAYKKWIVADYRRRMKARAIEYKGGKCETPDCGYSKCQAALEFHHRDPAEKDFTISMGSSLSWAKIQPELDKCVLLCATCHREEHFRLKMIALEAQERQVIETRGSLRKRPSSTHGLPKKERAGKVHDIPQPEGVVIVMREIPCQTCGKPTDQKKFCSQVCTRIQREKADWPSDENLKELVWAKPATTLAEELGVTSVAVKKRCKTRGIETPPRGYWAKLAVGKL